MDTDESISPARQAELLLKIMRHAANGEGIGIRMLIDPTPIRGAKKNDRESQKGQRHRRARRYVMYIARQCGIAYEPIGRALACSEEEIRQGCQWVASDPRCARTAASMMVGLTFHAKVPGLPPLHAVMERCQRLAVLADHRVRRAPAMEPDQFLATGVVADRGDK